jgi:hypothetical protein
LGKDVVDQQDHAVLEFVHHPGGWLNGINQVLKHGKPRQNKNEKGGGE